MDLLVQCCAVQQDKVFSFDRLFPRAILVAWPKNRLVDKLVGMGNMMTKKKRKILWENSRLAG